MTPWPSLSNQLQDVLNWEPGSGSSSAWFDVDRKGPPPQSPQIPYPSGKTKARGELGTEERRGGAKKQTLRAARNCMLFRADTNKAVGRHRKRGCPQQRSFTANIICRMCGSRARSSTRNMGSMFESQQSVCCLRTRCGNANAVRRSVQLSRKTAIARAVKTRQVHVRNALYRE